MARDVVSVDSRIEQVTVYARGARVRRVATLRAPLPKVVRLVGLPLSVIEDTVRTEVDGAAVITAIRVGTDTPGGDARAEETDDLRAAKQRVALAETQTERLGAALDRLARASIVEDDPTDEPPAPWQAVVEARRALVALRAARERALREQQAEARRELDAARRALEVATERDRDAGSARAARLHESRTYVELDVEASGQGGEATVRVEYQVAAARWAPSYVARLEGERARFELRAVVAQDSGEHWTGVALRLSTAEPAQFTPLPELHAQKIGRRQAEPAKRGFRAPPAGADALYADYDRGFPRKAQPITTAVFDDSTYEGRVPQAPPPPPPQAEQMFGGLANEVWDEESSRSKDMYAPPMIVAPAPMAAAPKSRSSSVAGTVVGAIAAPFALAAQAIPKKADAPGGGGGMRREQLAVAAPAPVARLDYGNLRMAAMTSPQRGTLVPAPAKRAPAPESNLARLPLPPGHVGEWAHAYDYAFASDGTVDVASDGAWHSLALTARAGSAKVRHVAVPREQSDVFRVAVIGNPFDGPLLPGPIDVYDRGQFLVTSDVDYTPPGGSVDVGLGVDPAVKIARNVEFHEEAAGMLRGKLELAHAITIEIENLSPRSIDLEVRERVPVTREGDDDIEVAVGKVEPPWERFTPDPDAPRDARMRGGYRWKLAVAANGKQLLRAGYAIKIAGKHELVGGNRREP